MRWMLVVAAVLAAAAARADCIEDGTAVGGVLARFVDEAGADLLGHPDRHDQNRARFESFWRGEVGTARLSCVGSCEAAVACRMTALFGLATAEATFVLTWHVEGDGALEPDSLVAERPDGKRETLF